MDYTSKKIIICYGFVSTTEVHAKHTNFFSFLEINRQINVTENNNEIK